MQCCAYGRIEVGSCVPVPKGPEREREYAISVAFLLL